ncbi:hypothetical protein HNR22_000463 [Micromonospora jinlongensis]|uniref:Uncharacterized protein n=1 Tax=Micromonospora jinlongensis TaxID=1287877 RepID=A0A7Z0BBE5_9ACTN|nr:hypothetical protein [Micromonospora jinlongensis]NYH40736.1 hypothetical protein [Micromonospora jinlongensis]
MDDELTTALARVRDAFARYPRRAVLGGCPHCEGSVMVDEHDLFSLTISLGSTVGDRDDVKSLLPVLLERLLVSEELYPVIVLGTVSHQEWRTWPRVEQEAVDAYLDAVWRSLLADHPSRLGSFTDPATFLDAACAAGERMQRFLAVWDATLTSSADRHLAAAVSSLNFARPKPGVLGDWLRRDTVRDRLHRAFERDHDAPWADDIARAYDLLGA